jgi:hypothetical protein
MYLLPTCVFIAPEIPKDLTLRPSPMGTGCIRSGRPLGDDRFLARLERLTGRPLKAGKRGPKPTEPEED